MVEIFMGDEARRFSNSDFPLHIGSDQDAHIHLPGVAGLAAHVDESRNHLFLQPSGNKQSSVYHNDEHVEKSIWLKSGDITRIGEWLINWHKNGDRLEAVVSKVAPVLTPPVELENRPARQASLPRVSPENKNHPRGSRRYLFLILFALLLCCAVFILAAKPVKFIITPAADSLTLSGFPPAFRFSDRFIGLPGSYTLRAEKTGYQPLSRQITISATTSNYQFELKKSPGLLVVNSIPPGAGLTVDGQSAGVTPLSALEVAPGRHVFRFSHSRYFPMEKTMEIFGAGKKQSLAVTLQPAWAMITVSSKPEGAKLSVDGQEKGVTPGQIELIEGSHRIRLQKKKFLDFVTDIKVQAGNNRGLPDFELIPAPGRIILSSVPEAATVSVDSVFKGKTPLTLELASEVSHIIDLVAAGFKPARKKISLQAAEERHLTMKLFEESGTIFLSCFPAEATLYVDGEKYGPATTSLRLSSRPHLLEVRAGGYEKWIQTITPHAGISRRIEVNLTTGSGAAQGGRGVEPANAIETANGQKMVLVRPVSFTMGASRAEPGRRANERQHEVLLRRPFYISVNEVTNADFCRFRPGHSSGTVGKRSLENDAMPVVNVKWEDAARYLNQLSKKEGLVPFYQEENGNIKAGPGRGTGYRLPTEAEWAYAARLAGRKEPARYPWPGSFPPIKIVGNFADESAGHILPQVIHGYNDSCPVTAPVGSFPANPVGLFDMAGNAAEWCHDFYATYNGMEKKGQPDPMGPPTGSHHLVRGSSWRDGGITELRFSYRRYSRQALDDIGFRFVRYAR